MRQSTEYLFWNWDHELLGGKEQPIRILEEGFLDAESCYVCCDTTQQCLLREIKKCPPNVILLMIRH